MKRKNQTILKTNRHPLILSVLTWASFILCAANCFAQSNPNNDEDLLNLFVKARSYRDIIEFNSSNIKQFWIDPSVVAYNKQIVISLKQNLSSVDFPIQLANVPYHHDCKIDVIADSNDFSFSVFGAKDKVVSNSKFEDPFLKYNVCSATFHIDETQKSFFKIRFSSPKDEELKLTKIILSFSENNYYLTSPGKFSISKNEPLVFTGTKLGETDEFTLSGTFFTANTMKKIFVSETPLKISSKIKNVGKTNARVYITVGVISSDGTPLNAINYPYTRAKNNILHVVSAEKDSNKIIVDSHCEWKARCGIAVDVLEDLSDVPYTTNLLAGLVEDMKENTDGTSEITISKPLDKTLKPGTVIKLTGPSSNGALYPHIQVIKQNEECVVDLSVEKDDDLLEFSNKVVPRGGCYVSPGILVVSLDEEMKNSKDDGTILIESYDVSF